MTEQWKDIKGYEGIYQVSNHGRVRSLARKDAAGRKRRSVVLASAMSSGYPYVQLHKGGGGKPVRVHVLVANAFLGACPEDHEVHHLDNDKCNNSAENLAYVTHAENMRLSAEDRLNRTVTDEQVQAIRFIRMFNPQVDTAVLAEAVGISKSYVANILAARVHVDVPNIDGTPVVSLYKKLNAESVEVLNGAGIPLSRLGDLLGVHCSTPYRALHRAGIYPSNGDL